MTPETLEHLPETAPFDPQQRAWLNGYVAGLLAGKRLGAHAPDAAPAPARGPLLFLYGSQTGSSERLARDFSKRARGNGFDARALGLDAISPADLAKESRVALVTSTYGDGDMPDNAQAFWDQLAREDAPRLDHLEYAVLALGDTNYVQFCEAGKKFDARFEALGARRLQGRADCDTDYEAASAHWFDALIARLGGGSDTAPAAEENGGTPAPGWSKSRPYPARLKTNRPLNGPGSAKETRHFEIALGDSGLTYEAGDALGVQPSNDPAFVAEILAAARLDGEEAVSASGAEMPLRKALAEHFDLSPFLADLPPGGIAAAELVAPLRKLAPRLYSISSSPKAHPGEVHLTVGIVRYELAGRPRSGVCSTFLADRVGPETPLPIHVHASPGFKPPADPAAPMIMVGPGTGIAPFRAFLEERRAVGATGRNWLFFGDQRADCDFLYRDELLALRDDGFLTRLDTAFSRDQEEKIYVQQRMMEAAGELWAWLQEGGHFYVCGDAKRMAKDVDAALRAVCRTAGGLGEEAAEDYVKTLKSEKRYQRDVY